MCKEQNVLNYYVVCNKLKNVIRTGWKDWKVKRERIESVAEHNSKFQEKKKKELSMKLFTKF